jgi:hypothetical protein
MRRLGVLLGLPALVLVGSGVAWAAGFTLTSAKLGGGAVTSPVMFPVSVTVDNKGGGHLGKPENGDIVTLVFSQQIDEPTLCSSWSNTSTTQSIKLQWSIVDGGAGNDTLQVTGVSATCSSGLRIGAIDLGASGYDNSTTAIDFPGTTSVLTVGATTTTLVATLNGQKNGTAGTVTSGAAAVWTPDAAVQDRSARSCGANLAQSTSTVQF